MKGAIPVNEVASRAEEGNCCDGDESGLADYVQSLCSQQESLGIGDLGAYKGQWLNERMRKSLSVSSGDFFSHPGGLSAVTSNTTILPEVSFPYIIFI